MIKSLFSQELTSYRPFQERKYVRRGVVLRNGGQRWARQRWWRVLANVEISLEAMYVSRVHGNSGHCVRPFLRLPRQAPGPSGAVVRIKTSWSATTPSEVSSRWRKFEKDGGEDKIGQEGTEVLRTSDVGDCGLGLASGRTGGVEYLD